MIRHRRVIIFSCIFCILLSVIGCNGPQMPGRSNSSLKESVTIAARDGSHTEIINAVKSEFEKDNNCTVNIVSLGADELRNNIVADAANSEGIYDVIMIDDPLMPEYIEKGVLWNLTQLGYSDDEDFVEKSRLLGKDPYPLGATYALPFSGNVQLIFYNQSVTGAEPPLDNWADILSLCQSAKNSGHKGYIIRGQSGNPIVSDFLPIMWAFGGELFDEYNNVVIDSPEVKEALEFYRSLYETGDNYDKNGLTAAISGGDAAIALGWPSWFITGKGPSASIAPIPGKKSSSAEPCATGEIGNWLVGVTENSKNPQLALKLAIYLTSEDVQRQALSYGGIPTRKSIFKDRKVLSQYPYFEQIYNGTNNSRVRPRTTKWSQIEEIFGEELVKYINNEQSVDDTLKISQSKIKALTGK